MALLLKTMVNANKLERYIHVKCLTCNKKTVHHRERSGMLCCLKCGQYLMPEVSPCREVF